nr:unnamed protein product [uncultured bacterium]
MLQRVIVFESVNMTDDLKDILVIARSTDGRILNVDTPEAITSWYLENLRQIPEVPSNDSVK